MLTRRLPVLERLRPAMRWGEPIAAAALAARDSERCGQIDGDRQPARERRLALVVFLEIEVRGDERAGERSPRLRFRVDQLLVEHSGYLERFEEQLVFALRVFLDLVEVQQLLPRIGELLVGGDDRYQGPEGQIALDHEVAADGIEEERRDLGNEIVGELDEELQAVDHHPDAIDFADPLGVVGALEPGRVMGVDLADSGCHLADPLGEGPRESDPLLLSRIEPLLQLGNEPHLDRIERDGGDAENGILDEHEDQQGDEHSALERRQRDRIADVAAEQIGLGNDGGHELSLRGPAKPRERETQHSDKEVVAQAPEHAFADDSAIHVEEVLEAAVDEHEPEERRTQQEEEFDLPELDAEDIDRKRRCVGVDRLVDDQLWKVKKEVEEWKRSHCQREQQDLLPLAVFEHELEDAGFHVRFR